MARKWAFAPDNAPPRLIRYTPRLESDVIAFYHEKDNLLVIDRQKYDKLTPVQKHILLKTQQPITRRV